MLRCVLAFCLGSALLSACSFVPWAQTPRSLVPFPAATSSTCVEQEVMPHITLVEPDDVKPGSEVTVQASGGYVRDACGRYEESARGYKLYFDDEPVADLQCYVNHCEGKFIMPLNALPGQHCLGVQKGACQVELEVGG